MHSPYTLILLALFAVGFAIVIRRSTELFYVKIKQGRARHVRGRMPPDLFAQIADVAARQQISNAKLRVVREGGVPRLLASGNISADQTQQFRNIVGTYPLLRIRAGRRPARR